MTSIPISHAAGYQAALDDIYRTFMAVKHLNKGRFDRDARQPQRLLAIARARGIMPPSACTLKVSGSKGKGTTARIAARLLQQQWPDAKIGLFVSPEEDEHYDRARINGIAMTSDQFIRHYTALKPQLRIAEATLTEPDYLSPLGIFLLLALDWFRTEGADYVVLETGRGVAHDEVGQIPSKVGILTSIMLEHADKLGPTLSDIARDKLSLCQTSTIVIASPQVAIVAPPINNLTLIKSRDISHTKQPKWLSLNYDLARVGVEQLLGQALPPDQLTDLCDFSASFGQRLIGAHTYVFEGLIHTDSLDADLLDNWQRAHWPTQVIASFPDDKDREQLLATFKSRGWPVTECVLTGTRGYLDYARTEADRTAARCTFAFDDVAGFATWLAARPAATRPGRTYLAGTQTYIRLVRKALALMATIGGKDASA